MKSTTKKSLTVLLGVTVMATLASCGPSQQEQDQKAAEDVATQFVNSSFHDMCNFDADYTTEADIQRCKDSRNTEAEKKPDLQEWSVEAAEPWGGGYAFKLKASYTEVVGVVKVGTGWKVAKNDSASEAVASQSDWACQVIGGPDCGAGK